MVKMLNWFRDFWRDRRGNVAMIFALSLLPVTVLSGGAVDFSQAMNARTRLSQALDAAALAVGVNPNIADEDALDIARNFIAANYPGRELGDVMNVQVSMNSESDTVTVTGQAKVQTIILGLIGIDHLTVNWETEVQRARSRLELVMVLDNTGSMGGSKIRNLRESAELLTEILHEAADTPGDVRIGLVPFAATVNVGTNHERVWWMDPDGDNPDHGDWSGGRDANHWDLFDRMRYEDWDGCVEARAIPMDIDNTPPSPGNPSTLFFPYFAPDEPDNDSDYRNDYLNDGRNGNYRQRLRRMGKYNNAQILRDYGPNMRCTTTPITPLTTSQNTIETAIDRMGASGTTNIPQGVGWGIRVISPEEPFTEGTTWDDRDVIKAMVILTDGENVMSGRSTDLRSDYGAYGFSRFGRLGTNSSSSSTLASRLNSRLTAACNEAKQLGIRVYTITFQVNSSSTRNLMQDCASNPSLYFDSPSSSALRDAFEMIAGDLTNLRLSR